MLDQKVRGRLAAAVGEIRAAGTFKEERIIGSPQGVRIRVGGREVLNFCANNYLGLASHPAVIEAAHRALDRWGYGMASVRFICGTQEVHRELEERMSAFLGTEETILYSSCFDANGGIFEPLLNEECALITDQLNHASIIDGARLCKARRLIYAHGDMEDLGTQARGGFLISRSAHRNRRRFLHGRGLREASRDLRPCRASSGARHGG